MIISNKYSGYQAGIRIYPGGGGGGGTSLPGTGDSQIGNTGGTTGITGAVIPPASTPFVSVPGMGDSQIGNTGGTTGIMGAVIPPAQPVSVPGMGNSQIGNTGGATGVTGAAIPPTQPITQQGVPSATGRPAAGSGQFYQPIYQPQYNNYVNPLTAGNVAQYGTNPGPSAGFMSATAPGGMGLDNYYQSLRAFGAQQSNQPFGMNYATFNPARKQLGANQVDLQRAYEYNPQQQFGGFGGGFMPQMQQQFNPFTNSFSGGFGGGFMPQQQFMSQMQSPFSFQPQFQPQMNMQTPFSSGMSRPAPQRTSSGPAQAIIGRSSQMRGTPNVMRRAEGGITSLMGKA